jgi:hypothetical protein
MTDFVKRDNRQRQGKYRKNDQLEELLTEMNDVLAKGQDVEPSGTNYPTLFIFGLPRSGTTLTYQLLSQCLDLGYVNNLIARFWLAPLHGIALAQAVLGSEGETDFQSDYGKTSGASGPHEFAYFWQHWLKVGDIEDMLVFGDPRPDLDWVGMGKVVRCMQDAFGKGMVFKTGYAANHIKKFSETFSSPLFIYIERDPADVAASILQARKSYYGNANTWWATYSPNYHDLKHLSFDEQIAGQVLSLGKTYEDAINSVDPATVIRVTYPELCKSPKALLDEIQRRLEQNYHFSQDLKVDPPPSFSMRKHSDTLDNEQLAVIKTLQEMNVEGD